MGKFSLLYPFDPEKNAPGDPFGGAGKQPFDDFIIRPGQAPMSFSPNDTVIGTKNGGGLGGNTVVININEGTLVGEQAAQELADIVSNRLANSLSSQWSVGTG